MPNILVVEDDTSLRETLVYNLTRQEYNVQAVGDGLIALKAARKNPPRPGAARPDAARDGWLRSLPYPAPGDEYPHPDPDCPR